MTRTYSRKNVVIYGGYPAVNVKVHLGLEAGYRAFQRSEGSELDPRFTLEWIEEHYSAEYLEELFWLVCEWDWEQIRADASEILGEYADVEQEGRSGGWAVVRGLPDLEDWDAIQLGKWRRFERLARGLTNDIPYQMAANIYFDGFQLWAEEQLEDAGANVGAALEAPREG